MNVKSINWYKIFNPVRYQLEQQIQEQKVTISQLQRKYDCLVEELLKLAQPKPKPYNKQIDIKDVKVKVMGWNDYRLANPYIPEQEQKHEPENTQDSKEQ